MAAKENKTKQEKIQPPNISHKIPALPRDKFSWIMFGLLALLIFYPPYFRGLFFDKELLNTHMVTAGIFIIFCIYQISRKELTIIRSYFDLAALGLITAYVLSTFVAANLREAIGEVLKVVNYFAIYWMISRFVQGVKDIDRFLYVLFTSGVGVAVAGLGTFFGSWQLHGAIVDGRISSTIQYPNTLAIYLTAINVLGIYLWAKAQNLAFKIPLGIGSYLLFITLLGAQSRGAWLVYPVVVLLLLIGLPQRVRTLVNLAIMFLAAFAVSGKVLAVVQQPIAIEKWQWLAIGAVILTFGQLALHFAEIILQKVKFNQKTVVAVVMIIAVLAVGAVAYQQDIAVSKLLPQNVVERAKAIGMGEFSVQERFYFYKDAMKIIADYPILGTGGGGWNATYRQYQSYLYHTTEVHNHFLQTWVEAGTIGFVFFITLWVLFFYSVYLTLRRGAPLERAAVWAVAVAALTLGLHSVIDFNLSLGAVSILLWVLFGLGLGINKEALSLKSLGISFKNITPAVKGAGVIALALVFLLGSFSLSYATKFANAAVRGIKDKGIVYSKENFEKARKFDPFTFNYAADLAQINLQLGQDKKDGKLLKEALDYADKAIALNKFDAQNHFLKGKILLTTGKIPEGIKEIETGVKVFPFLQAGYENLSTAYLSAATAYLKKDDQKQANIYLEKAANVPKQIENTLANLSQQEKDLWTQLHGPLITATPAIAYNSGKAYAFLHNWQEAKKYLEIAVEDQKVAAECNLWLAVVYEKLGNATEGQKRLAQAVQAKPELQNLYPELKNILS